MASRYLILFLVFTALAMAKDGQVCREPPTGVHFTREHLKDDIVMTIASGQPEVESHWSVKGVLGDQSDASELLDSFAMYKDGPLWNMVVTKDISIPTIGSRKANMRKIELEIECVDKQKQTFSHIVQVHIFPKDVLEKILITVPENTPTQQFIYHNTRKPSDPTVRYKHHPLPHMVDASGFLSLDNATGSVTLVKSLDYERDPTVMWYLTLKVSVDTVRPYKLRLFRIQIGNVNDNAPEFYRSDQCREGLRCKVVSYAFTMDKTGKLRSEDGNKIHAIDLDGDVITYSIVQAMPQQDFIQINQRTGELTARRPRSADVAARYVLTIQASDGYLSKKAAVVILIEQDAEDPTVDSILDLLDIEETPLVSDRSAPGTGSQKASISTKAADRGEKEKEGVRSEVKNSERAPQPLTKEAPDLKSVVDGSKVDSDVTNRPSGGDQEGSSGDDVEDTLVKPVDSIWGPVDATWKRIFSGISASLNNSNTITTNTSWLMGAGNATVLNGTALEKELLYLRELCGNVTLILQAKEEEMTSRNAAANETVSVDGDNTIKNSTVALNNAPADIDAVSGVTVEGLVLEKGSGVTLYNRNGSAIDLGEANKTCEHGRALLSKYPVSRSSSDEADAGAARITSSTSSRIVGISLPLIASSIGFLLLF